MLQMVKLKLKLPFLKRPVMTSTWFDWHLHAVVLCIRAKVQYMSPSERRLITKTVQEGWGGGSLNWAVWFLCTRTSSILIWHHHVSLGESLSSGNGGLYGYRKGRSERGGGKDGVFWVCERGGGGRCLQTLISACFSHSKKTVSGLFCEPLVCCLSPPNQPSVLPPSLSSGGGGHWSTRYLCDSVLSDITLSTSIFPCPLSLSHMHTYIQYTCSDRLFLADTSLSGRSPCHHGNPASGQE